MPDSLAGKLTDATLGRPNSQLPRGLLTRDLVLSCGEDFPEFQRAIKEVFGRPKAVHAYRCYALVRVAGVSFMWTGIGTGCLEPLLCEIISEVDRIILVGTAGAISDAAKLGGASSISEARIACAGISSKKTLRPNWPALSAEKRTMVSTDYYYGFSLARHWPTDLLWSADKRLAADVPRLLKWADLVDMETGQFYHLCRVLKPALQFVAIKGASNNLADHSEQPLHSQSVLMTALREAKKLLAITANSSVAENDSAARPTRRR